MGGIFISYRRDDSRHAAGRLYQHFVQKIQRDSLFMDVDSIEPGLDFVKVLTRTVGDCEALVAIIGPGWLNARDEDGERRLDNPDDFVRLELEAALARDVRVIPVLVDGAVMPRAADLPETLRPLVRRNAVRLAHERFGADAELLTETLRKIVVPPPEPAKPGWFGSAAKPAAPVPVPVPKAAQVAASSKASDRAGEATSAVISAFMSGGGEPHAVEPHDAPSAAALSRWPVIVATAFAVLALPAALLVGLGNYAFLRVPLVLNPTGADVFLISGAFFGSLVLVVLARRIMRGRGSALTSTEAALYWFGCIAALLFALPLWMAETRWFGPNNAAICFGVVVVAVLACISAFTSARRQRPGPRGTARGIYWLGCSVAVGTAVYLLLGGSPTAFQFACTLVAASNMVLAGLRWTTSARAERAIYAMGAGFAALIGLLVFTGVIR